jgi:hydroxyacylglutathione hydrolase
MPLEVGNWGNGKIWRVTAGYFPSNSYICESNDNGECFLIDVGLDGPAIDDALKHLGLKPHKIFCTHGHFDHAGSAAYFQKKYDIEVFMHTADAKTVKTSNFLLMAFNIPQRVEAPSITYIEHNFCTNISGQKLRFLSTPGHTPGSCVIELGSALFTGDTLYSRGVGLSQLPGESPDILRASILSMWDKLSSEVTIYPGHGNAAKGDAVRTSNVALLKFLGLLNGHDTDINQ